MVQVKGITINSGIDICGCSESILTKAVETAVKTLRRDLGFVLCSNDEEGISICLRERDMPAECYEIIMCQQGLTLYASDERGFIYGIYRISKELLGVKEFWFWNDQQFEKKKSIVIPITYAVKKHSLPCPSSWMVSQ